MHVMRVLEHSESPRRGVPRSRGAGARRCADDGGGARHRRDEASARAGRTHSGDPEPSLRLGRTRPRHPRGPHPRSELIQRRN